MACLVSLAAPRAFDVILVEDLSRLTRDPATCSEPTSACVCAAIEIVGVSDGIRERRRVRSSLDLKGVMNEVYLDDFREKTHRDMQGSPTRGHNPGGRSLSAIAVKVEGPRDPAAFASPARLEIDEARGEDRPAHIPRVPRGKSPARSRRR